jgi:hypothetical protein
MEKSINPRTQSLVGNIYTILSKERHSKIELNNEFYFFKAMATMSFNCLCLSYVPYNFSYPDTLLLYNNGNAIWSINNDVKKFLIENLSLDELELLLADLHIYLEKIENKWLAYKKISKKIIITDCKRLREYPNSSISEQTYVSINNKEKVNPYMKERKLVDVVFGRERYKDVENKDLNLFDYRVISFNYVNKNPNESGKARFRIKELRLLGDRKHGNWTKTIPITYS